MIVAKAKASGAVEEFTDEEWANITKDPAALQAFTQQWDVYGPTESQLDRLSGNAVLRGATFGQMGKSEDPGEANAADIVLEAVGSGIRDAALTAGASRVPVAGRLLSKVVTPTTGAIEGAVDAPEGMELGGALLGGAASIIGPRLAPRLVKTAEDISSGIGKGIGRLVKSKEIKLLTPPPPSTEILAEANKQLQKISIDRAKLGNELQNLQKPVAPKKRAYVENQKSIIEKKIKDLDAEADQISQGISVNTNIRQQLDQGQTALRGGIEKQINKYGDVGGAAGAGLIKGATADVTRRAPDVSLAAIAADPALAGRDLKTITPTELLSALKRFVSIVRDNVTKSRVNRIIALMESDSAEPPLVKPLPSIKGPLK